MTPEQIARVEKIRDLIADEPDVREVSMFGGRSMMVNERMIVSALKDGGLLVRVDAEQHDKLLERPGAMQAEMGKGRDMGPGWIEVSADVIADDQQLSDSVEIPMVHNRQVAGK